MVDFVRQVGSNFGNDYTNNPSLSAVQAAAGDMILAVYSYRSEGRIVAPPVWNGQTLVEIQARVQLPSAAPESWLHVFSVIAATSGTYNLVGAVSVGETVALNGSALVLSGPFHTTPFSAILSQHQWATIGYVDPSLSVPSVAAGDLVVDILSALHWNESYVALPGTTWTQSASQVERVALNHSYNQVGRQYVSTKAGSGTVAVGYTPSAGKPGFGYFAFVVKTSSGGPAANAGLRLKVQDRLGVASANDTGYTVIVRAAVGSTSVLLSSTSAAIVGGHIEIDSDSVGAVGDVVYVSVIKNGASLALDKNASGRATVVDLNGLGES